MGDSDDKERHSRRRQLDRVKDRDNERKGAFKLKTKTRLEPYKRQNNKVEYIDDEK